MILVIQILLNVFFSNAQIREAEYECGVHGRFEYCIDGIPGCVIGCHCHPGFYFDTDTKICEPNIKLTQNFRRQFDYVEPTRAYYPPVTPSDFDEPTTNKKSAVDEKIDEMTKDVDDLGDWLYNQFFKTIENQVINETKDEGIEKKDQGIITRRSGADSFLEKPSRRSHKYWKGRKKKKRKSKRRGLKSKLLRITEDDSLFDSSSGSTSDESSDSSDSSSDSYSDESRKRKDSSSDHGHKKIIVMNKRPRPPLPSFIFLPNMETPFFPPIGLPPPGMPMYPMIPVPPMMPPLYPFPGITPHTNGGDDCEATTIAPVVTANGNGHATNGHNEHATKGHNGHTTEHHDSTTVATEVEVPEPSAESPPVENEDKNEEEADGASPPLRNRGKSRAGVRPRQKLMQKLRDKLKRKNKLQNHFLSEYGHGPESTFTDLDTPLDWLPNPGPVRHKPIMPQINVGDELQGPLAGLQDVDFKYLSQLIHKADLNKTISHKPPMEITFTPVPPSRRKYNDNYPNDITQVINNLAHQPGNHIPIQPIYNEPKQPHYNIPYRKKIENTNDTYYANLGRQIASMIRNIDADKEVDIEIEKAKMPNNTWEFNGNSYGSRSYWERSIRSPFKYLMNSLKKEMNYLKKSNENLFSLENKVEIAASTEPPLGLRELENIISHMENAKSKLIFKNGNFNHVKPSRTSFNVNLLPGNDESFFSDRIVNNESHNGQPKYSSYYNSNTQIGTTQPPIKPMQHTFENVNTRLQNFHHVLETESKNANNQGQNSQKQLEPIFNEMDTKRVNRPMYPESLKITLESPIKPAPRNILQPSFQPEKKSSYRVPFQPDHKNSLFANFRTLPLPDAYENRNATAHQNNIFHRLLPTRKPNTIVAPPYKRPNNFYKSYAYTVLPLPDKLPLSHNQPVVANLKVPLMPVTTNRTYYQRLHPMVINQNNLNYFSGNNPFLFEKTSLPIKFRTFSNRYKPLTGRVEPSYFHHEIHHFDYFDI